MSKETTFKDFIEMIYKKPYDQVSENEIKETYKEIYGFGLSKEDLNDDGSDLETLKDMAS
jgi:hypothetical protein